MEDWDKSMDSFMIYFHSHGANRQEGRFLIDFIDSQNCNLCLIDMRANGQSKSQFCTLGIKESEDVNFLIKELQKKYYCKKIILYGRSMGAVSIMKFINDKKKGRI